MIKQKKSIPKRLLSLTLSAMLLFGILPMGVLAAPDSTPAAEYTIVVHGGTIAYSRQCQSVHTNCSSHWSSVPNRLLSDR